MTSIKKSLLLFFIVPSFFTNTVFARDIDAHKYGELAKYEYTKFRFVKSFGEININFVDQNTDFSDPKTIVYTPKKAKEFTDFLILKFKKNFPNIPYQHYGSKNRLLDSIEKTDLTIGKIFVLIKMYGDDFRIALHIRFTAGTFEDSELYVREFLSCELNQNAEDKIKRKLEQYMEEFAVVFFKSREQF